MTEVFIKKTICLNMIVKNESSIIIETLTNLCSYINFDYWVISDTGSDDNTKELICDFFKNKGIVGELVEHEWKDFGYNRTKAIECAFNKTDYLLIFDADDKLEGSFILPKLLDKNYYKLKFGKDFIYNRILLINNHIKWTYKGVLHEYINCVDFNTTEPNVIDGEYYIISGRSGSRNKNPNKYLDDAIILKNAFYKETNDITGDKELACRYAFYCAQSYKDAGNIHIEEAIKWYKKTLTLNNWNQEKYYACLKIGDLYNNLKKTDDAILYWVQSVDYDNERIEGIVNAMECLRNSDNHIIVNTLYHKFKNYNKNLLNKLFLDKTKYKDKIEFNNSISAFYVEGEKQSGYECCKKIIMNNIIEPHLMKLTLKNITFYYSFVNDIIIYSIIPLNIFQTWHTLDLPPDMKETVELLKKQNPEFKHYLYDDNMCREFIKNNFNEDVLYSFNKLIPGAFKSDLWRCCVLYIYGGIYLDIKYTSVSNFKLIQLTDKEYYVKDRLYLGITGIYNGLLSCKPNNKILYNCILAIVNNVKNNNYNHSELDITGPHMMSMFFNENEINNLTLTYDNLIFLNKRPILKFYDTYRIEQKKYTQLKYYRASWHERTVYNYPILETDKLINYAQQITKNIFGKEIIFYSGTPTIVKITDNSYLINIRWINYKCNEDGSIINVPSQFISLNSRFMVDLNFNKISEEIFLEEDFQKEQKYRGIGLKDIRIFNYNDIYYYIGTYYNEQRNIESISSYIYNISDSSYKLKRNIILPSFYDLTLMNQREKNWSFVVYKKELCIIYNWFPLQIGKINYDTNKLDIIEIKYKIPDYFNNASGSTCGYIKNNEIWFILHKTQRHSSCAKKYQHFFAIFDLDMNLTRYSELFKLGNCAIEFCIGLIITEQTAILSYSLSDIESIIAEYDIEYINTKIKWYSHL